MSKLYFRYGDMNSDKTTLLLQVAHNYKEKGTDNQNTVEYEGVCRKCYMLKRQQYGGAKCKI